MANHDVSTILLPYVALLDSKGFQKILDKLATLNAIGDRDQRVQVPSKQVLVTRPIATPVRAMPRRPTAHAADSGAEGLSKMHRAMLTALAQHPNGLTKKQVLVHTGYASSGPVSTAFAYLTSGGFVSSDGRALTITARGLQELGQYDPLPLGDELRTWLLNGSKLSTMEKALLRVICDAYPQPIRKGDVLEKAQYASSGPVSSAFAKLVAYNYVVPQGASMLKAAEELFT